MRRVRRSPRARRALAWSLAGSLLGAAAAAAPPLPVPRERVLVGIPERTDRGNWDGTWLYVSRDGRLALWMRTSEGKLEAKFRYESYRAAETFETAWDGRADYEAQNHPGTFAVTIEEADADTARGTWLWELKLPGATRFERGRFTLYRADDGRTLVVHFSHYEKKIRRGEREGGFEGEHVIVFRKLSKRLVLWDELPG